MKHWLILATCACLAVAAPLKAAEISGKYIEARTCDVWVAPCFANAEMNLTGKHALIGWKVEKGALDQVSLNGLSVIAVVETKDTLGLKQTGPARALLIVDRKADAAQRQALIQLATQQGGELLRHVVAIQTAPIDLDLIPCKEGGCAYLEAGQLARIETRCIDPNHDKSCGNEGAFYPPLAKDVQARAAVAIENSFAGQGLNGTWKEADRREAYVGTFDIP
ncbi:MAG: DUF1326 domain-containing protein [Planctomycetes bacterium]|nr:DUF1326 domain-containing protein [Planctomycetota bacterium]